MEEIGDREILCIQTGGTIDKAYPRTRLGYAFEISDPAFINIFQRIKPNFKYNTVTVCRKDSQDITDNDRKQLVTICEQAVQKRILVTHGTDTMIQTAQYLSNHLTNKFVVLTGAFLPETFKDSDADFNVGSAVAALQCLTSPGVYISMNGRVSHWSRCYRDDHSHMFNGSL